jgi:amino acid adenylation domain-containing protein
MNEKIAIDPTTQPSASPNAGNPATSAMDEVYIFPASHAQRRLWFLDQLEPGSPLYNVFDLIPLCGPIDLGILKRALEALISRHETLRTTIDVMDGEPVQVVAPGFPLVIESIDLSSVPEAERAAEIDGITRAKYEQAFDLRRGPLLRIYWLRLQEEESVLLVVTHHIISDGWSLGIFRRELLALYEAFALGQPAPLAELPIQYADYALWQRDWLQGGALNEQLGYWKGRLGGELPTLEFTANGESSERGYEGASQHLRLSPVLADSLKAISRKENATLFMTSLAAFFVLLHRYTGRSDLLIGTPVAGRRRAELEHLIGFFVNTLVIRVDLDGDPTFAALLAQVREACVGAYAHQDVPFESLVEALQPGRKPGRNPIFQVMFHLIAANTLIDGPGLAEETEEDSEEEFEIKAGTAKFDLSLDMCENSDGALMAAFEYSTDLFDDEAIRRMLQHLKLLLTAVAQDPTRRLSQIPILTDTERRLMAEWNVTDRPTPSARTVCQLIEAQVESSPSAIAVISNASSLTYSELNRRANKLARYLRKLGLGPEALVGVCVERSIETMVGLLGVLKAGGGYVPLDLAYPKERLAFMMQQAKTSLLLTEERMLPLLPDFQQQIVCLDRDWEKIETEEDGNPGWGPSPENLAYVIYTSGSTGIPKGVMIQHASLANFTLAAIEKYGVCSSDRVLQFASICFDTAAEEIYPTLASGATLVLSSTEALYSITGLINRCREFEITLLDLPTVVWHELSWQMASGDHSLPPSIRLVIVGGETAVPERLSMWHHSVTNGARLMNGYGPTETTVVATVSDLSERRGPRDSSRRVPIGHPIANVRTYILDQQQQSVPIGVTGELYIGGAGLARGYVGAPERTAERFVPDGVGGSVGGRLYRTGDMARYLANGAIEFLGRRDGQIKVRGFRVEVGEIEAALRAQADIRDAVVIARPDDAGRQTLAAYVVVANGNGAGASVSKWREQLKARLPDYMVPAAFVRLDEFPRNPSGKIDRDALPLPETVDYANAGESEEEARTETEKTIAAVWREVLGLGSLSVNSNFFDLGGHSLLLVRVNNELRKLFGQEIPITNMFKYPTIKSLAASLDGSSEDSDDYRQIHERVAKQREALGQRSVANTEALAK